MDAVKEATAGARELQTSREDGSVSRAGSAPAQRGQQRPDPARQQPRGGASRAGPGRRQPLDAGGVAPGTRSFGGVSAVVPQLSEQLWRDGVAVEIASFTAADESFALECVSGAAGAALACEPAGVAYRCGLARRHCGAR